MLSDMGAVWNLSINEPLIIEIDEIIAILEDQEEICAVARNLILNEINEREKELAKLERRIRRLDGR